MYLTFSTSSTIPALITVVSFSQTSAHPSVLHTSTYTGDFHYPSSSPTSTKSQEETISLLAYFTNVFINLVLNCTDQIAFPSEVR